jgi:phosphatidylglycerophosphate synthase
MCLALLARADEAALSAWYPIKAAGLFSIVMIAALVHLDAHPFARFGLANQVTTARTMLVGLIAGLIGEPSFPQFATAAALLSLTATALDGVDGWAARRAATASAFGARFDVEVDTLLMQALAILAWQHGKAGPWVLLTGLLRYAFVGAGRVWMWMRAPLAPTLRGKVICVAQIGALILAMFPAITPPLSSGIALAGLSALSYSFMVDTLRLWHAA